MQSVLDYPLVYTQHVAWGDMDAFGHVNNVMYYRYVESARLADIEHTGILSADVLTVVASNQCKYLKPVFYPDQLKISARIEELRNSAFRMHYLLWSEQQQALVAEAEAVIVCVDKTNMQKTLIPELVRQKLKEFELTVGHQI